MFCRFVFILCNTKVYVSCLLAYNVIVATSALLGWFVGCASHKDIKFELDILALYDMHAFYILNCPQTHQNYAGNALS